MTRRITREQKEIKRSYGDLLFKIIIASTILVLLGIIFYTVIYPGTQTSALRNVRRWAHVNNLLDSINEYSVDNNGNPLPVIDEKLRMLGYAESGCDVLCGMAEETEKTMPECLNLATYLSGRYIRDIPYDPSKGDNQKTFYAVKRNAKGRVTVKACVAEKGENIYAMR